MTTGEEFTPHDWAEMKTISALEIVRERASYTDTLVRSREIQVL